MVCLTPRFLFLAALVATAAMPSVVLQSEARAVDLVQRHHDESDSSVSAGHSVSRFASKGKGKVEAKPVIPLPPSAKAKTSGSKKSKKLGKGGHKRDLPVSTDDTWDPMNPLAQVGNVVIGDGRDSTYSDEHHLLSGIVAREADPEHHHHHHHHHHDRRDEEAQVYFGLNKRARSRIYGGRVEKRERQIQDVEKEAALAQAQGASPWDPLDPLIQIGSFKIGDGRGGSYSDTHHLLGPGGLGNILKRSPEPHHHHHHDHHEHDKVVVNGDNDDVHVHERRMYLRGKLRGGIAHPHVTMSTDFKKRSPHHHHHHEHDKVIVNGDNDKVHVHERREPHHHHHHDHDEHDKTVINGNNDDVHVHNRDFVPKHELLGVDVGVGLGAECGFVNWNGYYINCPEDDDASSNQQKRSDVLASAPGVPGTVDIMNVGGIVKERLASLVISSVPDDMNNGTTNGTTILNGTKAVEDIDAATTPFVLDASNTTQTQFYLVVSSAPGANAPSEPSASYAKTLAALKAATSSKADDPASADIKVTLQVPVFEPAEAAMRPYCATFDPNPPVPAPLTMERCFSSEDQDPANAGKMTEESLHKSQTFAYNPSSGIIRPMWFDVTGRNLPGPVNSTAPNPSANLTGSVNATASPSPANSTSGGGGMAKQMNFKIPTSNKNTPIPLPIAIPGPLANVTQTVNGTASLLPVPSGAPAPAPAPPSPQNVTLVFNPAAPAVHSVSSPSSVVSFVPDNFRETDPNTVSDPGNDDDVTSSDASSSTMPDSGSAMTPGSTTVTDAETATPSSSSSSSSLSASDATDGSMGMGATSSSDSMMPAPTVDEAAIEKMYQQSRHAVSN